MFAMNDEHEKQGHAAYIGIIVTVMMALFGLTFWMGVSWSKVTRSESDIVRLEALVGKLSSFDASIRAMEVDLQNIRTDVREIRENHNNEQKDR